MKSWHYGQLTDTVVITGDHSWGRNLEECSKNLAFIAALPGSKILLRGNHDMFWEAKKKEKLNEQIAGRKNVEILPKHLTQVQAGYRSRYKRCNNCGFETQEDLAECL